MLEFKGDELTFRKAALTLIVENTAMLNELLVQVAAIRSYQESVELKLVYSRILENVQKEKREVLATLIAEFGDIDLTGFFRK